MISSQVLLQPMDVPVLLEQAETLIQSGRRLHGPDAVDVVAGDRSREVDEDIGSTFYALLENLSKLASSNSF